MAMSSEWIQRLGLATILCHDHQAHAGSAVGSRCSATAALRCRAAPLLHSAQARELGGPFLDSLP